MIPLGVLASGYVAPAGGGEEDTYDGARALSGGTYAGFALDIEIIGNWSLSVVKVAIASADTDTTLNIRYPGSTILHTETGLTLGGMEFTSIPLSTSLSMSDGDVVSFEFLFGGPAQKLWRTTNYLYQGTLWNAVTNRLNNYSAIKWSETPGFGVITT